MIYILNSLQLLTKNMRKICYLDTKLRKMKINKQKIK